MKKLAEITNMSYKQLDATEHQIRLVSGSYVPFFESITWAHACSKDVRSSPL